MISYVITAVVAVLVASIVTAIVVRSVLEKKADTTIGNAEGRAREILDKALKDAEDAKREKLLEAKEESIRQRSEREKSRSTTF